MNYIDLIIVGVVALFVYIGYLRGFIRDLADLLALVGAVAVAAYLYRGVGSWLVSAVSLPAGFSGTIAFFLIWFAVMLFYYGLMIFFYDRVPNEYIHSSYNRWFGLVPGLLRGILFVWFTVNLLYLLAVSGTLKADLGESYFSKLLTSNNPTVSRFVTETFGPAAASTIDFLTVKPQSSESLALGFTTTKVKSEKATAKEMLVLINKERKDHGARELVFDDKLAAVGEAHNIEMFARGYFSHNTPEGKTPFDRMNEAKINYMIAGENLALAPTLTDAFAGLMDSPGHKANMLSNDFGKVGISVVDGGSYGKMFAQEFTN